MTAYVIFIRKKTYDQAGLAKYAESAAPTAKLHPVERLAFYGAHETLEGTPVEGAVVLSFPSMTEAKAWYDSPEYQAAAAYRKSAADFQIILVEGIAQPTASKTA